MTFSSQAATSTPYTTKRKAGPPDNKVICATCRLPHKVAPPCTGIFSPGRESTMSCRSRCLTFAMQCHLHNVVFRVAGEICLDKSTCQGLSRGELSPLTMQPWDPALEACGRASRPEKRTVPTTACARLRKRIPGRPGGEERLGDHPAPTANPEALCRWHVDDLRRHVNVSEGDAPVAATERMFSRLRTTVPPLRTEGRAN